MKTTKTHNFLLHSLVITAYIALTLIFTYPLALKNSAPIFLGTVLTVISFLLVYGG